MAVHSNSRALQIPVASCTSIILSYPHDTNLISRQQFTITSAPEDPYVSVHIRQVGDFTQALGSRLGVGPAVVAAMTSAAMKGAEKDSKAGTTRGDFVELDPAVTSITLPHVRIDGPYGAPAEDVFNSEVAILVGAGIGKSRSYDSQTCGVLIVATCNDRCYPFRLDSQAHLVQTEKGKAGLSPTRRVLLGLSRRAFLWVVPEPASGGRGCTS